MMKFSRQQIPSIVIRKDVDMKFIATHIARQLFFLVAVVAAPATNSFQHKNLVAWAAAAILKTTALITIL